MSEIRNVIIIGSGPAGLTAAIYCARANLSPLLFAGAEPGGQLTITTEVENYPGFPVGIQGPELMDNFRKQALRFKTEIIEEAVEKVELHVAPKLVTAGGKTYKARSVIIATGATAKWLGLESEKTYRGKGVSACATCDGFFFRGEDVCVVGGGDTALEEALFLTNFAKSVTIIHRRDQLRASKIMIDRTKKNEKIKFVWNSVIEEIIGDGSKVTELKLNNVKTNEISNLPTSGLFVAIGHFPNTELFKDELELDEKGYIKVTDSGRTATSIAGVFAAGDVRDHYFRQAITAAGMGCMAAIETERFLEG